MAQLLSITLRNSTSSQHVYHATDNVLGKQVLSGHPLDATESTAIELVADENGHGRMMYVFKGGVDTIRDDLTEGDVVNG